MSFMLATYDGGTREYTAYTTRTSTARPGSPNAGKTGVQARTDSNGTFTDLETGHWTYKFAKVLPENYDKAKTTPSADYGDAQPDRDPREELLRERRAGLPSGCRHRRPTSGTRSRRRRANNCHDPLAHSRRLAPRREATASICHSTQTKDAETGNSVDMALMVHKIHAPALQSTPYIIWGNRARSTTTRVLTYPQNMLNCANCHEGRTAAQKPTQSDVWCTKPNRRACGSCHDKIDFAGGTNHPKQTDDTQCATCHIPDSGVEFDNSVKGSHTIALKSKQLKGLTVEIVSASNVAPDKSPTIVFKFKNGDGSAVNGSTLNNFRPIVGGPTTSYKWYFRDASNPQGGGL